MLRLEQNENICKWGGIYPPERFAEYLDHAPPKVVFAGLFHFDIQDLTHAERFKSFVDEQVSINLWRVRFGPAGGGLIVDLIHNHLHHLTDFTGQFGGGNDFGGGRSMDGPSSGGPPSSGGDLDDEIPF